MRFGRHGSNTPNPETLIRSGGVHTLSKAAAAAMRSFRLVAMQPRSVSAVLERLRDPESAQLHHLDSLDLHNAIQIGRCVPSVVSSIMNRCPTFRAASCAHLRPHARTPSPPAPFSSVTLRLCGAKESGTS